MYEVHTLQKKKKKRPKISGPSIGQKGPLEQPKPKSEQPVPFPHLIHSPITLPRSPLSSRPASTERLHPRPFRARPPLPPDIPLPPPPDVPPLRRCRPSSPPPQSPPDVASSHLLSRRFSSISPPSSPTPNIPASPRIPAWADLHGGQHGRRSFRRRRDGAA
jgi:hypothetical protein